MASNFFLISTTTVGSGGTPSVTFSNIPQTYTDLMVVASASMGGSYVTINGLSSGYYSRDIVYFDGYPVRNYASNNGSEWRVILVNGASAGFFGVTTFYIPDYTSGYGKSTQTLIAGRDMNTTSDYYFGVYMSNAYQTTTNAINSITFNDGNTIAEYSKISLYGIKKS